MDFFRAMKVWNKSMRSSIRFAKSGGRSNRRSSKSSRRRSQSILCGYQSWTRPRSWTTTARSAAMAPTRRRGWLITWESAIQKWPSSKFPPHFTSPCLPHLHLFFTVPGVLFPLARWNTLGRGTWPGIWRFTFNLGEFSVHIVPTGATGPTTWRSTWSEVMNNRTSSSASFVRFQAKPITALPLTPNGILERVLTSKIKIPNNDHMIY